jgi:hypothetical protein
MVVGFEHKIFSKINFQENRLKISLKIIIEQQSGLNY